jgi:hypothetical protein
MVIRLIWLRFLQIYRSSGDLGLFRFVFITIIILPLIFLFLIQRISIHPWPFVFPAVVLYVVWMIHSKRKDYHFLLSVMPHPRVVFIAEYFVFTLPAVVLLLTAALFIHALAFLAAILIISNTVPSKESLSSHTIKLRIIPAGMFEWQSGIRRNLPALVLFYLPGLFGFYQIWLPAISLLLITMVFVSFYSEYEPLNMIAACECSPWRFLMQKIIRHAGLFALLVTPLLLIALIHDEFRLIAMGYFLSSLNLLTFSILLKYHQYRPHAYSGAHQFLTSLACFISVILPVAMLLALVNLLLAAGAYKNLKSYLDAGH